MMVKKQFTHIILGSYLVASTGCSSIDKFNEYSATPSNYSQQKEGQGVHSKTVHFYAAKLVSQLLSSNNLSKSAYVAVGTFMPASGEATSQQIAFGNQLQESVNTVMAQAGFKIEDYKLRNVVKINSDHDLFLSRNSEELKTNINAEYLLVGTLNMLEKQTQVNARLVAISDRKVVAAATTYIPNNVSWSDVKVQVRDGKLFRKEY
ncbi:FlgO family outer membrane protein [Pseudoalteromonas denitrificans]|jgi:TolB-like protein|uniref:FlgO domain-containing protein n=1 Tax=Pseudoalteromonas denitrificans DSM 6059 TaxID=1123010 RepID=A0A1I1HPE8_9GAMM|nr:FlgO family outer membrane protein [Pseudoalteromonas denitrificans]SFC25989.1 hypothetical protein SAMN02745724_01292 [Pseudoalteromonas denitrificans DSM 6059]